MKKALLAISVICFATACGDISNQLTVGDNKAPSHADRSVQDALISQSIRRDILQDATMSPTAHNIFISTESGHVTLRGAVTSNTEKQKVLATARGIPGVGEVHDELEVLDQNVASKESQPIQ